MNIKNTFVENVTLKEKIELILNTNLWSDSSLNESKTNIIEILEDFTTMKKDANVLTSLVKSRNLDLVKNFVKLKTSKLGPNNNIVVIPFGLINSNNTEIYGVDHISNDLQYLKELLTIYVTALKDKDIVVIGLYDNDIGSKLNNSFLRILTEIGLDAIIFANNTLSMNEINDEQLIFEKSSHENQLSYTLLNQITTLDKNDIKRSLDLYEEYKKSLANNEISLEEFYELVNEIIVFNIDDIDQIVSKIKYFTDKIYNRHLKLNNKNKKNTKKGLSKITSKLPILITLLLYFNLPLIYAFLTIANEDYLMFFLLVIFIVNYLIFKVVFRKTNKQKKNLKELLPVINEIDYLEPKEERVFDNALNKEGFIVDNDLNVVINWTNEVFKEDFNMGKYCHMLCNFMEANGLKTETRLFKELFSTMLASRLFITSSRDNTITIKFLKYFSSFIGSSIFIENLHTSENTFDMLLNNEKSELIKCLNSAQKHTDKIHLMVFKDINLVKADKNFSELIKFIEDPYIWNNKNKIKMSENIWFIFLPKGSTPKISEKILLSAFNIDIDVELVEPKDSMNKNAIQLSYNNLMDSFNDSKELYYLNEELWKKIDKLEIYLNKNFDFKFNNQFVKQLERYQSMYLMSNGEPYEAIDNLLSQKILPVILNKTTINIDKDEESLLVLCDRLFGLDNFIKSRHLLAKINKDTID